LPRLLKSGRLADAKIIAFDGPTYFVSRPSLQSERLAAWRGQVLDPWAPLLDLVVWLDAPDQILAARINSRSEWHRLKGEKEETTAQAFATNRRVYETAIARPTKQTPGRRSFGSTPRAVQPVRSRTSFSRRWRKRREARAIESQAERQVSRASGEALGSLDERRAALNDH
jgi:hypothetical protein